MGSIHHGAGDRTQQAGRPVPMGSQWAASDPPLDELAATTWLQAYDAAWLARDWSRLSRFLAPDVEALLQESAAVLIGRRAVLANLREFLDHAVVHEYNATEVRLRRSQPGDVVTYLWQLDWTADNVRHSAAGRDLLALRATGDRWRLAWRVQTGPD